MSQSNGGWPVVDPDCSLADRLAAWCQALVAIESVYGNEREIADTMERWSTAVFKAEHIVRIGNNLVLGDLSAAGETLALVGHLDTVPPPDGTVAEVKRDDGRIYGLGSSDMKAGVAVMCALAEEMATADSDLNLVVVLYEKEEGPHEASGLRTVLSDVPSLKNAALAICMEPTENAVQLGCVGSMHATLTVRGKAAHSARPWQGENAIHNAAGLLTRLGEFGRKRVSVGDLEFSEVMNATLVSGGRARTIIPDHLELNINYRFAPGRDLGSAEAVLRAIVAGEADIEITDRAPSGAVCADNQLMQRLLAAVGQIPEPKQAWTDVARLAEAGIDAINFGPGSPHQAHQVGEYANVALMVESYELLRSLFE